MSQLELSKIAKTPKMWPKLIAPKKVPTLILFSRPENGPRGILGPTLGKRTVRLAINRASRQQPIMIGVPCQFHKAVGSWDVAAGTADSNIE